MKPMTVEQTLADLVAIDSVSSRSNSAIIAYIQQRCESRGLRVRMFPHIDASGKEKINLVARSESENDIELALVGHTDTVPYDPAWTDALRLTETDGKLFGRGACDTKAFIAAALTAIETIDLTKLEKPLALIFTCDEEIGCLGAKRLAVMKPFKVRYAIVGEPTQLQPMRAGKGYCLAEAVVHGREAHSAYPQLGESAIFRAAKLIGRIEEISRQLQSERHDDFDPPYTTLNVGVIEGGSAKNIVAGECRFTLEWRPIPKQKTDHVLQLVREAIADLQKIDPGFACDIDAGRFDDSFETARESALIKFLEDASSSSSGTVAFGTEAPSMIALGAEAAVFGPGDIHVAHRSGEYVPSEELKHCVEILMQAIRRFCLS
ncbi:MAG TPA: acetylornithine deacetylase [Pyrinomonadaceae bacterium]|jgi:acetylornithine deacetylase|nr:acetylornithine deacetylase [Pyrinomonadaceae bacterium]